MQRLLLLFIAVFPFLLTAQNVSSVFPIRLTEQELQSLDTYTFTTASPHGVTTPPEGNLRNMAEWEEKDYILITWVPQYRNTLAGNVDAAVKECKVLIISNNPTSVETELTDKGIALDSLEIIERGYNTIWMRDYAANNVHKYCNNSLILVDWIYNRQRPLDDEAAVAHADLVGLENLALNKEAVYPNPANAITVVPVRGVAGETGVISLLDATGRVVEVIHEGSLKLGLKNYFFHAANYAKGTYRVSVQTNERIENHNLVIF